MSDYIKAKLWKGNDLKGLWTVTYKIDGVRAFVKDGEALSRAGKPLYGLSHLADGDYEIFCGDWESSITAVRTVGAKPLLEHNAYNLSYWNLDPRLKVGEILDPTDEQIEKLLQDALDLRYEGLVLRQGDKWLKVKPVETYDVAITRKFWGKGKHIGRLGGFITELGRVGTGLTDKQREEYLTLPVGTVIEVDCMSLTPKGKFRHPRFVRVRYDK